MGEIAKVRLKNIDLTHFSTVGAGQDAPPTVDCVGPRYKFNTGEIFK